jgi:tetrapyrrole methylase family protein/MazG family protein
MVQITLVGLGPGDIDALTRGAERALREASEAMLRGESLLLLRTAQHPVVDVLREWKLNFETFDSLYDTAPDFETIYRTIAGRVLQEARTRPVVYAVPGHPLFGESSVEYLRRDAAQNGLSVRLLTSASFVEAALTAAGVSLGEGCDVRDALTLTMTDSLSRTGERLAGRLDVSRGLLLYQVFDSASASHAKLCLMRDYPDDWEILLIRQAGIAGQESVTRLPLFRLDRVPIDHLTSVYVPPLPPRLRRPDFSALVGLMARLRAPEGCPWDREQTHASLKRYFVEETYEVLEAIDAEDPDLLCEELGDALLQVVFHAQLASEEGLFTIDDVTEGIVRKMVRRHPHVFGESVVSGSDEVLQNWERIKRAEKAGQGAQERTSILDGVPKGLPALMQAMEISKRVAKVGFEWDDFESVLRKMDEEVAELKAELAAESPDRDAIFAELGDLLFTMVQVARWQHLDPEEALRAMLHRFSTRFRYIERRAREQNRALTEMTLAEMDQLWDEAKVALG